MEQRIALIGIIVEDLGASPQVNAVLHAYSDKIVGRMGFPYRDRGVHIISVILDASGDDISALAGKLGRIGGVSVKTMMTNAGDGHGAG